MPHRHHRGHRRRRFGGHRYRHSGYSGYPGYPRYNQYNQYNHSPPTPATVCCCLDAGTSHHPPLPCNCANGFHADPQTCQRHLNDPGNADLMDRVCGSSPPNSHIAEVRRQCKVSGGKILLKATGEECSAISNVDSSMTF